MSSNITFRASIHEVCKGFWPLAVPKRGEGECARKREGTGRECEGVRVSNFCPHTQNLNVQGHFSHFTSSLGTDCHIYYAKRFLFFEKKNGDYVWAHFTSNFNGLNCVFCKSRFIDYPYKNSIQSEIICLFNYQDKISLFFIQQSIR